MELITSELDEAFGFAIDMGFLSANRDAGYRYWRNWTYLAKNEHGYSFASKKSRKTKIFIGKRKVA